MPTWFIVIVVLMVVGVVAQLFYKVWDQRWFAQNGQEAQAEVTNVRVRRQTSTSSNGPDGGMTTTTTRRYIPTVRFTTTDGYVVETETPSMGRRRVGPGDAVNIRYDPNNPQRARIMW